jgi:hypothetical protein
MVQVWEAANPTLAVVRLHGRNAKRGTLLAQRLRASTISTAMTSSENWRASSSKSPKAFPRVRHDGHRHHMQTE